jgi:hypothetical protein
MTLLRTPPYVVAFAAMLAVMLVGLPTAQAAETTLTLACEGTKTETSRYGGDAERRKAISLSIIINFAAQTVTGFPSRRVFWFDP